MLNKIFSSLKPLGFKDTESLELYKNNVPVEEEKKNTKQPPTEIDINTLIFDKEVTCPICSKKFKTKVVKTNAPRIKSRDSDFLIRYNNINPLLYDVWVCPTCGYAALKSDFFKIKKYQKQAIISNVSNQWNGKVYPPILNEENAIERLKLALLNTVISEGKDSTKAYLCLKIGWIYRLIGKEHEEKEFLEKALQGFIIAYEKEHTPFYGLDTYLLMYLIGELNRRIGKQDEALLWFGNIITSRSASYKIKEKARDMRDLIRNT